MGSFAGLHHVDHGRHHHRKGAMALAAALKLRGQNPLGSRGCLLGGCCRDHGRALGHGQRTEPLSILPKLRPPCEGCERFVKSDRRRSNDSHARRASRQTAHPMDRPAIARRRRPPAVPPGPAPHARPAQPVGGHTNRRQSRAAPHADRWPGPAPAAGPAVAPPKAAPQAPGCRSHQAAGAALAARRDTATGRRPRPATPVAA